MIRVGKGPFTRSRGFSLLELLIALAFLAFIAVGLASSLGLGIQIFARTGAQQALSDPIAHRIRLRTWLIAAASPAQAGMLPATLIGSEGALEFTTTAPSAFAPGAYGLRVRVSTQDRSLRLVVTPMDQSGDPIESIDGILATSATEISISYYDGRRGEWVRSWSEPTRIPTLVRIEVAPGSIPDWPEFTVRLARGS